MFGLSPTKRAIQRQRLNAHAGLVREAARKLDRLRPGWERQVDVETLNLRSSCRCVLGQVFGTYTTGLAMMRHAGISVDRMPFTDVVDESHWIREITRRRDDAEVAA